MPKEVKAFLVGDGPDADYSHEEIDLIVYRLTDWFASPECDRRYKDPKKKAIEFVQLALTGKTTKGKVWNSAPDTLAARLRAFTNYDIEKNEGISSDPIKSPAAKKARQITKKKVDAAKKIGEYDPDVAVLELEKFAEDQEKRLLASFPELDNDAHKPLVKRLSMLYAQQVSVDKKFSRGPTGSELNNLLSVSDTIGKQIEQNMKVLGIHPDQLAKKVNNKGAQSISDLAFLLDDDPYFRERTMHWAKTRALQLWWCTVHPNFNGDGPNMHPWEMWHMTRTKPIHFECKCGQEYTLVDGFTPDELFEYLVQRGVLVEGE